jgi:DTW domain-containing protein
MSREFCLRCRRPKAACMCPTEPPMETRSRIVLLMHPKEYRRQKTGTGRLACLNLASAEIIPGVAFDEHPRVRALADDPANYPALLYPSPGAINLSSANFSGGPEGERFASELAGRRLVVFLIDSTWRCSHAVLRESPSLLRLPRLQFQPRELSRWIIKRQPHDYCLSTIEAIHELLIALEAAGLDAYPDKERLLRVFADMQAYQLQRKSEGRRPRFLGCEDAADSRA